MKKKLTAAILSVVMLLMSGSVFAAGTETAEESKYSGEYGAFEQMAKYVAEIYIVFQSCLKIMTHCWCSC